MQRSPSPGRHITACGGDAPGGSYHSGQQSPLLLHTELHDSWSLKLLSDPPALVHIINEHELHSNLLTVGRLKHSHVLNAEKQQLRKRWPVTEVFYLQAPYNLPEWECILVATNESGGGKPENFIQVGFSQSMKTCMNTVMGANPQTDTREEQL